MIGNPIPSCGNIFARLTVPGIPAFSVHNEANKFSLSTEEMKRGLTLQVRLCSLPVIAISVQFGPCVNESNVFSVSGQNSGRVKKPCQLPQALIQQQTQVTSKRRGAQSNDAGYCHDIRRISQFSSGVLNSPEKTPCPQRERTQQSLSFCIILSLQYFVSAGEPLHRWLGRKKPHNTPKLMAARMKDPEGQRQE